MTTREENLKKINDELELMSDEELEQVVGGYSSETADDSRFLNVLLNGTTKYHHCDRYCATRLFFEKGPNDDVRAAWSSLGIILQVEYLSPNRYYKDGKKISQSEAWAHAEKLVGKHLTKAQWDW